MLLSVKQSVLTYLRSLAKKALVKHHPTVIGVAGSVGKSSTRNAIEAVLKDHFPTTSVGNSETGIPLGILGMKPSDYSKKDWLKMLTRAPFNTNFLQDTKYLIAEMGIDEPDPPKNMEYLLTLIRPDIAVSLNAEATHTMQFEKALSKEQKNESEEKRLQILIDKIAEEDTKIITKSDCKIGIYNADDGEVVEALEPFLKKKPSTILLTFGKKSTNDVSYGTYRVSLDGTSFLLYVKQNNSREELRLAFKDLILPEVYQEIFAATILACLQTGLALEKIKSSLEKNFTLPKGRSSIFKGINGSVIIDATYNASKVSVLTFLELVDTLKKETNRPVVMLLGDMRELGNEAKIEHEEVAGKLVGIVDYLYLVGPLTRQFVLPVIQEQEEKFKEIRWFDTSLRAGEFMKDNLQKNAIVLAKGSQNTIFLEEAVKQILEDKKDQTKLCRQEDYWMKVKTG